MRASLLRSPSRFPRSEPCDGGGRCLGGAVSLSLEIRRPALLPETMAAYPASLRVEHLLTEYRFEVRRDTHTHTRSKTREVHLPTSYRPARPNRPEVPPPPLTPKAVRIWTRRKTSENETVPVGPRGEQTQNQTQTLHGTGIYDQLGWWCQGGKTSGAAIGFSSPMERLGKNHESLKIGRSREQEEATQIPPAIPHRSRLRMFFRTILRASVTANPNRVEVQDFKQIGWREYLSLEFCLEMMSFLFVE